MPSAPCTISWYRGLTATKAGWYVLVLSTQYEMEIQMRRARQVWYLVLTYSVDACVSQTSRAGPASQNIPIAEVRPDSSIPTRALHNSIYREETQRFDVQLTSTIHSTTGDSIPRIDSSRLTAI